MATVRSVRYNKAVRSQQLLILLDTWLGVHA